jgi:putative tricarboxylic transport membrane protein
MALDRWVALVLLGICLAYGYTAWFMMDSAFPPIMKRLAVWPSSFPKVLSIAGIILSLIVLLGIEKGEVKVGTSIIDACTNTNWVRRLPCWD